MANSPMAEPINDIWIRNFRPKMSTNVVVVNEPKISAKASKIDDIYGVNIDESAILKIFTAYVVSK